ncbi:hypothetical protein [Dictyobacter vulcani]|nr:hypothetical protein [Dictyobacter vulcani]
MAKDSIDEETRASENNHEDGTVEAIPTVLGGGLAKQRLSLKW